MSRNAADHASFLRAVLDNPDDDLPRTVYADWLDEHARPVECGRCHGDGRERGGWDVDAGACTLCMGNGCLPSPDAARAEFIRVQCEHARMGAPRETISATLRSRGPDYWDAYVWDENRRLRPGMRVDVTDVDTKTMVECVRRHGLLITKTGLHGTTGPNVRVVLKRDEKSAPFDHARWKMLGERAAALLTAARDGFDWLGAWPVSRVARTTNSWDDGSGGGGHAVRLESLTYTPLYDPVWRRGFVTEVTLPAHTWIHGRVADAPPAENATGSLYLGPLVLHGAAHPPTPVANFLLEHAPIRGVDRGKTCPRCGGAGVHPPRVTTTCNTCRGAGRVPSGVFVGGGVVHLSTRPTWGDMMQLSAARGGRFRPGDPEDVWHETLRQAWPGVAFTMPAADAPVVVELLSGLTDTRREFRVTNAPNRDALNGLPGLPRLGTPHGLTPGRVATHVSAQPNGDGEWAVTVRYAAPAGGSER